MVGVIDANLTMVDNADNTTNWSSSNTIAGTSDTFIEGAASISLTKVSEEIAYARLDYNAEKGGYWDLSSSPSHIYFWANVANAGGLGTEAQAGIRIYI